VALLSKFKVLLFLVLVSVALFFSAFAQEPISLEQGVRLGLITLISQGGYLGNRVTILSNGSNPQDYLLEVRKGDVLLTKAPEDQNMIVSRDLNVHLPANQEVRDESIWTFCLDWEMGPPDAGAHLDVAPSLAEWAYDEAPQLLRLLDAIDAKEVWDNPYAQNAIWNITNDYRIYDTMIGGLAPWLLRKADVDIMARSNLPHMSNLAALLPGTTFTVPPELLGTGDVQVTLTWEGTADLDLHIIDPAGEDICWWNSSPASGGEQDWDDWCNPVSHGGPENIYWPYKEAPSGEYIVFIDYYEACRAEGETAWTVRIIVDGDVRTFTGTISPGDEVEVTRFIRGS
jgi:hypothetical protein